MQSLSSKFAALADPVRFSIVERLLREGELSSGGIAGAYEISGAAVSQHLRVLRDAGLLSRRTEARRRIYAVELEGLSAISSWVDEARYVIRSVGLA